jgi:glycosyltransferase involved in cell wall biosynthesis
LREAFASGRPVIATKVGDIPEIVRHRENGLLIEPGNPQALASAILEFISDPELAAHCAANGLRYATENFSFDKMMDAKLRADLAVLRKKQGREFASRSSQDITSSGSN